MKIKRATTEDSQEIFHLTQDTIRAIYKNVYKQYQIDFFSDIHSKEATIRQTGIIARQLYEIKKMLSGWMRSKK